MLLTSTNLAELKFSLINFWASLGRSDTCSAFLLSAHAMFANRANIHRNSTENFFHRGYFLIVCKWCLEVAGVCDFAVRIIADVVLAWSVLCV